MNADKTPIRTTLSALALARARKLMDEVYGMSDLNDLIERLITDEYERRHGPIKLQTFNPLAPIGPLLLNEPRRAKKKHKGSSSGGSASSHSSASEY